MKNPLKTVVLALSFVLLLGLAPHALAQSSFVPLAEIPGLTSGDVANSSDLASFFNNLYKYLIGLAAILAIIEIIWGGLEYSTQDNISKKSDGKARIYQALSGLLLVLAPALVFGIINPSILNLGVNLSPLSAPSSGTTGGTAPTTSATITAPASGCSSRPGQYLEVAVCATQEAANAYRCSNGAPLIVPSCATRNAQGVCVGNIIAYCGKSIQVKYYRATYRAVGHILSSGTVIPRDAQIQSTFASGCSADRGVMHTDVGKISFTFATPGNCPADSGVPTYQTGGVQTGYACADQILSCQPN